MAAIGGGHEIDEHHSRAARNGDHQTRPDVGGACFIHSASFSPVTSRAIWQWPPQHWPPLPSSPHYVGECRLWLIGVSTAAASSPASSGGLLTTAAGAFTVEYRASVELRP